MNKNLKTTARLLFPAFLVLLLALGCKKIFDLKDILHQHDNDKLCQVLTITSTSSPSPRGGPETAQFTYNKSGDPTTVAFSDVGTGRPNLIFRYDKYGRLSDYAGVYSCCNYEFWYHYQYQNNRIVSDSLFGFGVFSGDTLYPSSAFIATDQYQYDAYGRVSQVITRYPTDPNIPPNIANYSYDNHGNLIRQFPSNVVYDDKVNIHRTNDIWMFVDRDYSVNNPLTATSYNGKGLPLSFGQNQFHFYGFLYNFDITTSTIVYKCSDDKNGNKNY